MASPVRGEGEFAPPLPGRMKINKISGKRSNRTKKRTSRKGAGKKKKDRKKREDVNGKMLAKENKRCINRTTNYG